MVLHPSLKFHLLLFYKIKRQCNHFNLILINIPDVDVDAFAADVKIECVDDVEFDFCEIDPLYMSKDEDWSILSINGRDTNENVQNAQNEESEKIDLNLEIRRSTRSTRKRQLPLPSSPVHNFESEDSNNPNSDDLELKQEFDEEEVAPPPSPTLDYSEDESEDDTDWRHKAKKRKKYIFIL